MFADVKGKYVLFNDFLIFYYLSFWKRSTFFKTCSFLKIINKLITWIAPENFHKFHLFLVPSPCNSSSVGPSENLLCPGLSPCQEKQKQGIAESIVISHQAWFSLSCQGISQGLFSWLVCVLSKAVTRKKMCPHVSLVCPNVNSLSFSRSCSNSTNPAGKASSGYARRIAFSPVIHFRIWNSKFP